MADDSKGKEVAVRRPLAALSVDVIPVLDASKFEQMQRIAVVMATASLMPEALRKGTEKEVLANCFIITNQAVRWGMDPFALAQCAYVISGKLGYEGKVVAGVVNSHLLHEGGDELIYTYTGKGAERTIVVSGKIPGEKKPRDITGTLAEWQNPRNDIWKKQADQQLAYRGAVVWARRHMSRVLLGIYSDDELAGMHSLVLDKETGEYVPDTERPTRPSTPLVEIESDPAHAESKDDDAGPLPDHLVRTKEPAADPTSTSDGKSEPSDKQTTSDPAPSSLSGGHSYQVFDVDGSLVLDTKDADEARASLHDLLERHSTESDDAYDAALNQNKQLISEIGLEATKDPADDLPPLEELPKEYPVFGPKGKAIIKPETAAEYLNALAYQLDTHKDAAGIWKQNVGTVEGIQKRGGKDGERAEAMIQRHA
jgi:hypothetical protein